MESARLCCWRNSKNDKSVDEWHREQTSGIVPVQSPDNDEVLWIPKKLRATQISLLPGCYWRRATERHAISHILKIVPCEQWQLTGILTFSRICLPWFTCRSSSAQSSSLHLQARHSVDSMLFGVFMSFYNKGCMKDTFGVCALLATLLFYP